MSKYTDTTRGFTQHQSHEGLDKNAERLARDVEADGTVVDSRLEETSNDTCLYIMPGRPWVEEERLATFGVYPTGAPVKIYDLAKAGFSYTGYKDRVKCHCCGYEVDNWVLTDDPFSSIWHMSTCNMALGEHCDNIPLLNKAREILLQIQKLLEQYQKATESEQGERSSTRDTGERLSLQGSNNDEGGDNHGVTERSAGNEGSVEITSESPPGNDPLEGSNETLSSKSPRRRSLVSRAHARSQTGENVPRKRHRSGSDVAGDSLDGEGICLKCRRHPPSDDRLPCGHLSPCVECSKKSPPCTVCDLVESEERDE